MRGKKFIKYFNYSVGKHHALLTVHYDMTIQSEFKSVYNLG